MFYLGELYFVDLNSCQNKDQISWYNEIKMHCCLMYVYIVKSGPCSSSRMLSLNREHI